MFPKDELNYKITAVIDSASIGISKITTKDTRNYLTSFLDVGFVQIPSIINSAALADLFTFITDHAHKYFVSYRGKEREYFGRIISGHRFKRLFFEPQTEYDKIALENDENWKLLSSQMNIAAHRLSEIIQPIMTEIANDFSYNFGSIFYYGEEDFIGLHHDAHYHEMINAQFPLSVNVAGCIRVKYKEKLCAFYDKPGCLNILDSKTWHDVPIISKIASDKKATRMNLTLRYMS